MYYLNTDRSSLNDYAASLIEKTIKDMNKRFVTLAIPGGTSVSGIFEQLKTKTIDWNKVHIFMVDERLVPIDDQRSNFRLAMESFLDSLMEIKKLPEENVHPFILDKTKNDLGINLYGEELKKLGGKFDIVLLSSGEDGHIGALFPDHHSIRNETEFFLHMTDSPKPPPERMTMSRKLLLRSETVLLLFFGESKKNAFRYFRDGSVLPENCPNKYVEQIKDHYILSDLENNL